jgi:hypothetical protein
MPFLHADCDPMDRYCVGSPWPVSVEMLVKDGQLPGWHGALMVSQSPAALQCRVVLGATAAPLHARAQEVPGVMPFLHEDCDPMDRYCVGSPWPVSVETLEKDGQFVAGTHDLGPEIAY